MSLQECKPWNQHICYACGITEDDNKKWLTNYPVGWLCHRCYHRYIANPKNRKKYNDFHNSRKSIFKGRRLKFATPVNRIGICNSCRAAVEEVNAQTNLKVRNTMLHHESYDPQNPLKYTIELCHTCHARFERERRIRIRDNILQITKAIAILNE